MMGIQPYRRMRRPSPIRMTQLMEVSLRSYAMQGYSSRDCAIGQPNAQTDTGRLERVAGGLTLARRQTR